MTDVFVRALYNRIKAGQMTLEQVPEIYREDVQAMQDNENNYNDGGQHESRK